MINYIIIFAGEGVGASSRYALATWIGQKWGRSFPLGTFVINVSGSFVIGLLMTLMAERLTEQPSVEAAFGGWLSWRLHDLFFV